MKKAKKHWLEKNHEDGFVFFDYVDTIHERWLDIKGREMWIHGVDTWDSSEYGEPGVEYMMATKVIKNLHVLKNISRTEPITIHLHTCGGFVEEGLAIYDAIKLMPYKVKMISYTHARSMSSIILQAADERILLPNSYYMFHDGEMYTGGTKKQVVSSVEFWEKQDGSMMEIYIDTLKYRGKKYSGWSRDKIKQMLREHMDKKEDVYLTAQQAVEWGLADKILRGF